MTEKAPVYDIDVTDIINDRIFARTTTSDNLDVLLGPRPLPTKYVHPNQTINPPCHRRILPYKTDTFNPGNRNGTWSGFISNINIESMLKNQHYAAQKFPQAQFIPNSDSDLYNSQVPVSETSTAEALYPNLFNANKIKQDPEHLGDSVKLQNQQNQQNQQNLGNNVFNNHTRQQLKDS